MTLFLFDYSKNLNFTKRYSNNISTQDYRCSFVAKFSKQLLYAKIMNYRCLANDFFYVQEMIFIFNKWFLYVQEMIFIVSKWRLYVQQMIFISSKWVLHSTRNIYIQQFEICVQHHQIFIQQVEICV